MAERVQDGRYACVVCGASFLFNIMQGVILYCTGIFYIILKENLEAGDSEIALVTSLTQGFFTLACLFVGMIIERFGERPLTIIGSLLALAGSVCSSFATKVFHLYITYSLLVGLGMGMAYICSLSILPRYFDKYKATAIGISLCGIGIGSFVFPPIIKALIDTYGWRGTFLMMGGIYAHGAILGSLFAPINTQQNKRGDQVLKQDSNNTTIDKQSGNVPETANDDRLHDIKHNQDQNEVVSRKTPTDNEQFKTNSSRKNIFFDNMLLLKNLNFRCMSLSHLISYFSNMIIYTHFGSYILSIGFSGRDVVYLYIVMGISKTLSRALAGLLAEMANLNILLVYSVCYIAIGIITTILPMFHNLPIFYAYSVVFCIFISPPEVFAIPITVDSVPFEKVAIGIGLITFACSPGMVIGPPAAALLHGVTHKYSSSFYLSGILYILAGAVMIPAVWRSIRGKGVPKAEIVMVPAQQCSSEKEIC